MVTPFPLRNQGLSSRLGSDQVCSRRCLSPKNGPPSQADPFCQSWHTAWTMSSQSTLWTRNWSPGSGPCPGLQSFLGKAKQPVCQIRSGHCQVAAMLTSRVILFARRALRVCKLWSFELISEQCLSLHSARDAVARATVHPEMELIAPGGVQAAAHQPVGGPLLPQVAGCPAALADAQPGLRGGHCLVPGLEGGQPPCPLTAAQSCAAVCFACLPPCTRSSCSGISASAASICPAQQSPALSAKGGLAHSVGMPVAQYWNACT